MPSEQQVELHSHVALVATDRAAVPERSPVGVTAASRIAATRAAASRISLLRLSLMARLLVVAAASALIWGAVLWALR